MGRETVVGVVLDTTADLESNATRRQRLGGHTNGHSDVRAGRALQEGLEVWLEST